MQYYLTHGEATQETGGEEREQPAWLGCVQGGSMSNHYKVEQLGRLHVSALLLWPISCPSTSTSVRHDAEGG